MKSTKATSSALLILSRPKHAVQLALWQYGASNRVQPADSLTVQLASLWYSTTGSPLIWTGSQTLDERVAALLPVCVGLIRGQNTRRKTAVPSDRQLNLFHQQTYVIQTIRRVDRKHSGRFLLEEILVEWYSNCFKVTWNNILNFQFNFNLPFLMFAVKLL